MEKQERDVRVFVADAVNGIYEDIWDGEADIMETGLFVSCLRDAAEDDVLTTLATTEARKAIEDAGYAIKG